MAYIENRTVHDADSHVMEMPDKILEYLEPSYREEFISEANKAVTVTQDLAAAEAKQNDPEFRAGDEAELCSVKITSPSVRTVIKIDPRPLISWA